MRTKGRRLSADQGFTITEVLVSVTILLVVVISVIGAIEFAGAATRQSAQRDGAINAGNGVIEIARNLPYDELGTISPGGEYGDPPGLIPTVQEIDGYSVETEVSYGRDTATGRATYKVIEVVVSWEEPFANSVRLETAVMGKSVLANTGDVAVQVLDADSFEPIEGVRVVIDPSSGSNRTQRTEASGEAFFGYVAIGALGVTAEKTGYLIDVSPLIGAIVPADAIASYTLHAQRPSTGVVNVTGSNGQPIAGATVTLTGDTAPTRAMTRTTGADGRVVFGDLFKGTHVVAVSASGRVSATAVLNVTAGGQTVTVGVSLADPRPLTVTVLRQSNGQPLPGATVRVQGPSPSSADIAGSPAVSTSSGLATFVLQGDGTYTITASGSGFTTQTRSLIVAGGGPYAEVFSLAAPAPGSIRVEVRRSSNGSARAGVSVRLHDEARTTILGTGTTNSSGDFTFSGLQPGAYQVSIQRSGSNWIDRAATVAAGQTTVVRVSW